jgi:hypothetical protein
MPTNRDRRAALNQWAREVNEAQRVPLVKRPKAEAIISKVCSDHGICRKTLFNWKAKLKFVIVIKRLH